MEGALPVPQSVTNEVEAIQQEYRAAFGIACMRDVDGAVLANPDSTVQQERVGVVEASLGQLVDALVKRPEDIYQLDPRKFEELVAELLERDGFKVELTPRSGDGGIDSFAVRNQKLGRFLFGVQCKRNAPDNRVEVNIVRELVGALDLEHLSAGGIVTTSFFTRGARETSAKIAGRLSLVDFDGLRRWLLDRSR